jgi:hypothetical protein
MKHKIGKSLAKLTKRKRVRTQINITKDEKGNITTNVDEIKGIIRELTENSHSGELEEIINF